MSEAARLVEDGGRWRKWGPYLSERAWGTVREDYSAHGGAWNYLSHDEARSQAFRWNEDGMAGVCDDHQILCLAFGFWNGVDPILKERIFGLTGNEGNHGEDAKEYWWYVDSTPSHSWMVWRYIYPQSEFPYRQLVEENARRGRLDPECELLDTGVLDSGYWDISIDYAKHSPDDMSIRLTARNRGESVAELHVLPTLWFRNTWSWGLDDRRPEIHSERGRLVANHHTLGSMSLTGSGSPELLFCENESNSPRLWDVEGAPYPKDGINDHVLGDADSVNPARTGTKAAMWYRLSVPAGGEDTIELRLSPKGSRPTKAIFTRRRTEADKFYAALTPPGVTDNEASVMRQAFAGMLWSKQFYHYDVDRWLDGDPAGPRPPRARLGGRNYEWRHLNNSDVISMPDTWEYPWYAAWDLAFHTVALAHVDPDFAKGQLLLMLREWYMHPNGQLPAYEWAFGDVNPPVHAWAALRVFEIDGSTDFGFLERAMHKLLLNFTWWVNRKDSGGNNVFEGGFLGLDNIGPFDRSADLPEGIRLEQADGTAWMAMYCLNLLEMALVLAGHDATYEDIATKFFEHFAYIASAIHTQGLWNEKDGFYYDVLRSSDMAMPLEVRSMVGLIPLFAVTTLGKKTLDDLSDFAGRMQWFLEHKPQYGDVVAHVNRVGMHEGRLLSVVSPERLARILAIMLDENEFLSPYGLRSLSAHHRDHPYSVEISGMTATVDYEPAESTTGLFGGNSNWRGPVWFPVNYLVIESLRRFARFLGPDFDVECPTGSGRKLTVGEVADELGRRLVALFLPDHSGQRPVHGPYDRLDFDPDLAGLVLFHEYFHGDNGMGLGASHQTGWTGLVADLITSRRVSAKGDA
ncbi:MAG: glucosidase [Actinomycetota bacterium]|nr:glucosidase [Actinomycetota bacterium]